MDAATLLSELVGCPSVNPGEQRISAPPYGEAGMVDYLDAWLQQRGGAVHREEVLPGRPNIWAHFEGHDRSRLLLLDAHTDTVSHANMTIDPFAAEVRAGRLYGRGACDTKGPMAAMLMALDAAIAGEGLAYDVIFAGTCDEEHDAAGAKALLQRGLAIDFAVIAEPTELQMVTRHKGVVRAQIDLLGQAAHSSLPQQGQNAIYAAARVVTALEELGTALGESIPDPELGHPTLAVTIIEGGTAMNIVPERCRIQVDRRLLPMEDLSQVKAATTATVAAALAHLPADCWTIKWSHYYPPLETVPAAPELDRLGQALLAETGAAPHCAVTYCTNGGFYAQAGIPSVIFGPGSIEQAHTKAESIDLTGVTVAARVLRRFLVDAPPPSAA
jgi:succinyl-diaminopimelate desuccinylase